MPLSYRFFGNAKSAKQVGSSIAKKIRVKSEHFKSGNASFTEKPHHGLFSKRLPSVRRGQRTAPLFRVVIDLG